jgi:uncharacterized cupredoxin-like copper-binding protein
MSRKHIVVAISCALVLMSVGCSSSSTSSSASTSGSANSTAGGIAATEQDFSISVSPSSATAGEVSFTITNNGPSPHEFLVVKSDKDPGSLKVGKDGTVDEDTLNVIDEQSDIAPSAAPTLTTNLDAGSYILICNLPGHYAQGMHVGFTVS